MSDIEIRTTGRAGRITLTRPHALNALSYDMCMAIDTAMRNWREDDAVDLIVLDAEGEKAFCAGGDIAELYETGRADGGRKELSSLLREDEELVAALTPEMAEEGERPPSVWNGMLLKPVAERFTSKVRQIAR